MQSDITTSDLTSPSTSSRLSWGRAWRTSIGTYLATLSIITITPLMVFYFYISVVHYGGALSGPIAGMLSGETSLATLWQQFPALTVSSFLIYLGWLFLQIVLAVGVPDFLHRFLPYYRGGAQKGAFTPAGHQLSYEINGLQAWLIAHVVFMLGAFVFYWWSPTVIVDHWGPMLWVVNIAGNATALFAYLKAHYFPTNADDRKFSGSTLYDYYMGIEFNPRIGKFDFKLFFNGRPGIIAWTLINFSFAAKQYYTFGYVTNSMILVNILHGIYVVDFFWNEAWYLKTIDIAHDHFGWMLAWGDHVWLPYMYTLQGFYLAYNPVILSTPYAAFVLVLGIAGYLIFRTANAQKDLFRRTGGDCQIWGKQAEKIEASYTTADGTTHKSNLMVSGFWKMGRHMNYTGDLMGCLAYSLACGTQHLLPYFYVIYMAILLVHRCLRDEDRCRNKYGPAWEKYCKRVPYRLFPGVF